MVVMLLWLSIYKVYGVAHPFKKYLDGMFYEWGLSLLVACTTVPHLLCAYKKRVV